MGLTAAPDPLRPPETDEEPWAGPDCGVGGCAREVGHIGDHRRLPQDDGLAPARGCLVGMALGLGLWVLLAVVVVIAWRIVR